MEPHRSTVAASQSRPLRGPERPGPELPELDGRILRMLLNGHTDSAIAGRLGIGRRTVQRRIRWMMDVVGVNTRIQLGWHARDHFSL